MRIKPGALSASYCALSVILGAVPALMAQKSASSPAVETNRDSAHSLSVGVGKSVIIDCAKPVTRVIVGLGDLAEATVVAPTQILVNGKAAGETSMILWEANGARLFYNVTVRPNGNASDDHLDGLRKELETELPGQDLKVSSVNGNIFLRGTVKDLNSSDRAVQIASTGGKVVNLLYVLVPPSDPQILLKVRFASVDRTRSKQLGINVFSAGLGNVFGSVSTGQFSSTTTSSTNGAGVVGTASSDANIVAYFPGTNIGATINALETKGVVEILAEPNLLAANGKQASFLAGGEYPFPVAQGSSGGTVAVTISFKEYGVRLSFIPTITPRGTIRLQVAPEVSSLDFTNAVEISGFEVPAIATRKVKTEVELSDGQSFAIGGLLDNRETETFQTVPFLGSIPILGKLFQSITRTKSNTELMVLVTAEIVAPIPAGTAVPDVKFPVDFMPPNSGIPMHTPINKPTTPPQKPSIPVEKLLESMQPEKPLTSDGQGSTSPTGFQPGGGTSGGSTPQ